jgi:hypothetical protein
MRKRCERHVARIGEKRNAYRLLVGKPEGKRPLGRPRRRWMDNIRIDLGEVGWGDMDWIDLAQDRNRWRALVNSVLNLRVPWNTGKVSSGITSSGLSSRAQLHRVIWLHNDKENSLRYLYTTLSTLYTNVRTTSHLMSSEINAPTDSKLECC